MEDVKRLVKLIIQYNDEVAFNQLIKKYYNEIYGFIYKQILNKDDAYDITQEIFIKVFLGIKNYDPQKSQFRTFLYSVANHYMIDMYRSKQYKKMKNIVQIDRDYTDDSLDTLEDMIREEDIIKINELVKKLPEKYESVIRLRFYADISLNEISNILNISLSNVKYYLYQGIKLLQKSLKEGENNEIIK